MIPFPSFEPDKSPFNYMASEGILNVLPTADGHKPMPSLVDISSALGDECLGATSIQSDDGGITIIAGTRTALYKLNTSTSPYSWTDISKAGGYNVPIGNRWSFALFGNNLIAANLGGVLQSYDITTAGIFADIAGSPVCSVVWVSGDYLVCGQLDGQTNAIQWSGLNDSSFWTLGKRGCDIQVFPDGGPVLYGFGSQTGSIVMQRDKFRYMNFAPNSGMTFTFSEANNERGILSQYSVANIGPNKFFYLSKDGFYMGIEGHPIGATRVDNWFFDNVDHDYLYDVRAVVDPYEKIVWWFFQKTNGTKQLLGYDWQLDKWCLSDQDLTEAVALLTPGVSWDGLDLLYDTIDDINVPFDSRIFKGGAPAFAAFTTDHKLAYFTGLPLAATLQTAQVELTKGARSFVSGARVEVDTLGFTAQVGWGDFHGDAITNDTAIAPSARSGKLPFRSSGRLHQFAVNLSAGTSWTSIKGISPDFVPEGQQ
ncbi:hypothetical protein [Lentilitoribacter sp. Alg239-R112]|uniref:hypothetical protein n=1 Tax=Lentilitoribacter sp. Alg239-R112 TaxID=2305987 RepID=UPI0013A699F8|nr:hypothetical protein [Lentilitoribacter sp. Alg239-R112]